MLIGDTESCSFHTITPVLLCVEVKVHDSVELPLALFWINNLEIKSESFKLQSSSCYKARSTCKHGNTRTQMAAVNLKLLDLPFTSESLAGGW